MKKVSGFIILAAIASLAGCYKETTFDVKPAIEFKTLRKEIRLDQFSGSKKDSVILTIKFQDGDGDLGLNEKEKAAAELKSDYNYIIRLFRKKKGVFQEFVPDVPYSGYFPRLKSDGKVGPIEGSIDYSVDFPHPFTPVKDSLKFQITIKDRAGNVSNTAESSLIILNEF
ncbi:hypothetical protein EMA8858_03282 [Emticicia aquatica]|jgi:hypothetical protein|uniref:DUF1735 domain-containing protein n=1 Tax=Emticicia aquatica TaxID=1681835 RepID=A0ABM9AT27_9BACT|nr:hypothetical protein [Emticicia aquatica]CAH0997145.1 hypothetical protein EMA8858_03282 [Emticicia aquatica]